MELHDNICALCKQPIERVDLRGTPFFEHASAKDSIVWQHIDKARNNHRPRFAVEED